MDRPDFGIGKYYAVRWTDERIAYLRFCAEERKMSASAIAVDIGLDVRNAPRIREACGRHGIKLEARGGRPPHRARPILLEIPDAYIPALERLSIKHKLSKADAARRLLAAIFEQGEDFLANLLDLTGD